MVDRVMSNFQFGLAPAGHRAVEAMSVASIASRQVVDATRVEILQQALKGSPCYVLRVPSVLTDDEAADDVIYHIEQLVRKHDLGAKPQRIDLTQLDQSADVAF